MGRWVRDPSYQQCIALQVIFYFYFVTHRGTLKTLLSKFKSVLSLLRDERETIFNNQTTKSSNYQNCPILGEYETVITPYGFEHVTV